MEGKATTGSCRNRSRFGEERQVGTCSRRRSGFVVARNRPESLPTIKTDRAEGIGFRQDLQDRNAQARAAGKILEGDEGALAQLYDGLDIFLRQTLHQPEAETQRPAWLALDRIARLEPAIPIAMIDVDRPCLDAMIAGVAHDLGRRVKAHRLAVEQRRGEHVRDSSV